MIFPPNLLREIVKDEMTDLDAGGNGNFRTVYDLELSSDGMKLLVVTEILVMMQIMIRHI